MSRSTLVATVTDDGIPRARSREEFLATLARRRKPSASSGSVWRGRGRAAARVSAAAAGAVDAARRGGCAARVGGEALHARRQTESPSERTSVCTCRGSSIAARATVQFEPAQIKVWEDTRAGANSPWAPIWFAPPLPADGKITTQVRFETPGTYVLRALADDGALTGGENVTIVVTNATSLMKSVLRRGVARRHVISGSTLHAAGDLAAARFLSDQFAARRRAGVIGSDATHIRAEARRAEDDERFRLSETVHRPERRWA